MDDTPNPYLMPDGPVAMNRDLTAHRRRQSEAIAYLTSIEKDARLLVCDHMLLDQRLKCSLYRKAVNGNM
jgi:hypothetical protein